MAKGRPRSAQTGRIAFSRIVWPACSIGVAVGGVAEFRRQADGQIDRLLPVDPVAEEAADFFDGGGGDFLGDFDSPIRRVFLAAAGPVAEERIDPQDGFEAGIGADGGILQPAVAFVVVEDRVGHRDRDDVGQFHDAVDVFAGILLGEKGAIGVERFFVGIEAEHLQRGQHAAAGFADRGVLDEEMFPDVVGLLLLGHFPELLVGKLGGGHDAVDLGDEIVIGDQFIDAPEQQAGRIGSAGGVGGRACRRSGDRDACACR